MNTFQTMDRNYDELSIRGPVAFAASPLPVLSRGPGATRATGIALTFADGAGEEEGGEDRFNLLLVDAAGEVFSELGPFAEEEVVAVWRDIAAKAGLVRMIVREDGILSPVGQQIGRLVLGRTRMRRRHGSLCDRRPRFLVRRKTGRLPVRPLIHRGENEIIARS